ncbi:MAG: tRNA (N6-isopentenyl adenosine(37)-C2)-methylthiotransferase MiaB [Gemmatimonadota bacterium]
MATTAAQRAQETEGVFRPQGSPTASGADGRRAYVETYGCQMNVSDGELMEGVLAQGGYRIVHRPEDADVILINTCAIREHAEQRVLGRVGQLQALRVERPDLVIGVTGCMAQRLGADLFERAPYVDLVVGPDGYRVLPERLAEARGGRSAAARPKSRGLQLTVLDLDPRENYAGLEQRHASATSAWIPIQRGCDHRCTFCIVPYVRGPEKNRAPEEILDEVRRLADRGLTEVTLLGQTVNSYAHGAWSFARLLAAVARVDGIRRVRFTSPHPNDVTDDLIGVLADEEAVCEQLHLPVQSGSDRILKRMVRRYGVEAYLATVERVRAAVPDIALSTDVIVAFPGETEAEFEDTLALMRAVRFDDAYTYRYSPRDGTPATRLPAHEFIADDVAQARLERLIDVSRSIQDDINRAEVGRVEEVLVERAAREPGQMMGRTRRAKVVAFPGTEELVGRYVPVRLTGTTGATFVGALASS